MKYNIRYMTTGSFDMLTSVSNIFNKFEGGYFPPNFLFEVLNCLESIGTLVAFQQWAGKILGAN